MSFCSYSFYISVCMLQVYHRDLLEQRNALAALRKPPPPLMLTKESPSKPSAQNGVPRPPLKKQLPVKHKKSGSRKHRLKAANSKDNTWISQVCLSFFQFGVGGVRHTLCRAYLHWKKKKFYYYYFLVGNHCSLFIFDVNNPLKNKIVFERVCFPK